MKFPRITVVGALGFEDVDLLGTGHDHSLEVYLQSDESESVGLLLFVFLCTLKRLRDTKFLRSL